MQRGVRLVQALLLAVPSRGQRVDIAAGRLLAWPQQRLPSLTGWLPPCESNYYGIAGTRPYIIGKYATDPDLL